MPQAADLIWTATQLLFWGGVVYLVARFLRRDGKGNAR